MSRYLGGCKWLVIWKWNNPHLGDLLTTVIKHLLTGMILQVPPRNLTHIPRMMVFKMVSPASNMASFWVSMFVFRDVTFPLKGSTSTRKDRFGNQNHVSCGANMFFFWGGVNDLTF